MFVFIIIRFYVYPFVSNLLIRHREYWCRRYSGGVAGQAVIWPPISTTVSYVKFSLQFYLFFFYVFFSRSTSLNEAHISGA